MAAHPEPREVIALRPLGSPLPLALAGLTVASLVVSGLQLGWVPQTASHQVGVLVLAAAVPLQLLGATFALPARDGAGASSMGVLAVSWGCLGLILLLSAPGSTSDALGLALLAGGVLLAATAGGQTPGKPLLGAALALAAARFILTALYELSGATAWETVAGIVGLVVFAAAAYLVSALALEDAQDEAVVPTGRRSRASRSAATDGATREPGVRAQP